MLNSSLYVIISLITKDNKPQVAIITSTLLAFSWLVTTHHYQLVHKPSNMSSIIRHDCNNAKQPLLVHKAIIRHYYQPLLNMIAKHDQQLYIASHS